MYIEPDSLVPSGIAVFHARLELAGWEQLDVLAVQTVEVVGVLEILFFEEQPVTVSATIISSTNTLFII